MSCVRLSWFSDPVRRLAYAAAVLLALHWTAAALLPPSLSSEAGPGPGRSAAQVAAAQDTPHRRLTRASSFEDGSKPERITVWPTAEDAAAFRPAPQPAATAPRATRIATLDGRRTIGGTASFDARGPPRRTS